jgi:glycerol-3-phosphate dehydrogenase (NAD(P)+)
MTFKIATLGNGAWGSALSMLAAEAGHKVLAWTRTKNCKGKNSYDQTTSLKDLKGKEILIIALPIKAIPYVLHQLQDADVSPHQIIVASKGLDPETGHLLSNRIESIFTKAEYCCLSGPNLAQEVHQGLPAASSLYCSKRSWTTLKELFPQRKLRLYHCQDKIGIQIGGALKNVIALATGWCHGLGFGRNLQAALITRGLHEVVRFGLFMGAKSQTFYGLSGMGDMIVTCSGSSSRNFRFGMLLAQGKGSLEDLKHQLGTVEGLTAVLSLQKILVEKSIELPLCQAVYDIVYLKKPTTEVIELLLNRPLKSEGVFNL